MKVFTLALGGLISLLLAGQSMSYEGQSPEVAMSECREEAISAGMPDENSIQDYIDQCMQNWADMTGYVDPAVSEEAMELPAEEPVTDIN